MAKAILHGFFHLHHPGGGLQNRVTLVAISDLTFGDLNLNPLPFWEREWVRGFIAVKAALTESKILQNCRSTLAAFYTVKNTLGMTI